MRTLALLLVLAIPVAAAPAAAGPGEAVPEGMPFASIDGGALDLSDHDGPVLLVNTASRCGYTPQYEALQRVHETYGPRGLMVVAVPSDSFRQELSSAEDVAEFCEVNFGLTLPMTDITPVRGRAAHPVYAWLRESAGYAPRWNFEKVLIEDGAVLGAWRSNARPEDPEIAAAIEDALR